MAEVLMGVDLSLTCTGVVVCPVGWAGDWRRVHSWAIQVKSQGPSEIDRTERMALIAGQVVEIAKRRRVTRALFEGYAYSRADSAHTTGELGGIVRYCLLQVGIPYDVVRMQSARYLLLGRNPRQDPKGEVHLAFAAAGRGFKTQDESDAMCVVNYELSELGGHCFVQEALGAK